MSTGNLRISSVEADQLLAQTVGRRADHEGYYGEIYVVRRGDQKFMLRKQKRLEVGFDLRMFHESESLQWAGQAGLRVPKVRYVGPGYLIEDFIYGQTLDLSPAGVAVWMPLLIEQIGQLHRLQPSVAGRDLP